MQIILLSYDSRTGATNNGGWIHACESSSLPAKFEVLVSPARPRAIIAANESSPSHGAGFLAMNREYIAHIERPPLQAARRSACWDPGDAIDGRYGLTPKPQVGGSVLRAVSWDRKTRTPREDVRSSLLWVSACFCATLWPQNLARVVRPLC